MTSKESTPADAGTYDPDNLSRVIILVNGTMDHGGPFWCYVAVKPSMLEKYHAAQAGRTLNLYDFDAYGEVIVSAEGTEPPDYVTQKVAEIYNCDLSTFFQPIDPLAEIDRRIEALKAKDEGGT
ncbi:MAG TPA: hypothetical protein DCL54_11030 [Alphaproteobacteria bacterium]|nr:hypothetical protein [Alphaproteobacteria bacterium]HAJ47102.1 hypothetical protein [Alphaproteobacteria bacterium]